MTLLKIIFISTWCNFFQYLGYLIYFKKKYNLINDFEANRKADRKTESYARKVGLIELLLGIALLRLAYTCCCYAKHLNVLSSIHNGYMTIFIICEEQYGFYT